MTAASTTESRGVIALKAVILAAALWLYLHAMATTAAIVTSVAALAAATVMARLLAPRLRLGVSVAIALVVAVAAFPLGQSVMGSTGLFEGLEVRTTLLLADSLFFGLLTFGVVFGLRVLSTRVRILSVLEAAFVVGSVAWTFAAHRNQMIHHPRWLADWAWSRGWDPHLILQAFGITAAVVSVFMLLRVQRVEKLVLTLLAMLILGGVIYWRAKDLRIEPPVNTNGLGLTEQEQKAEADKKDGEGKGGGKGDGKGGKGDKGGGKGGGSGTGDNPFSGDYSQSQTPVPIAVAVFHDDYEPLGGIMYFRQEVLSRFDGHHLVSDKSGQYDRDVIKALPQTGTATAAPSQDEAFFVRVPTSMYLLMDHPQPPALTSAAEITPIQNPDPSHFVSAYDVASLALSMAPQRLVGRRSVPDEWSAEERAHYLTTPDDPRYGALSDEIVRDVDPRFVGDDMMKALALKAWLEDNGFYTRKERHEDATDPAADFLFGSLRGYCVHFAHAAVHLFRSQGIAARVAVGYGVETRLHGGGSTVLIFSSSAHAWPEIHVAGVGWIPFDIYPKQSDEPPPEVVDQSLESLLGELARKDKTGGRAPDPESEPFEMPWRAVALWSLALLGAAVAAAYGTKLGRRVLAGIEPRWRFIATLDRLADLGAVRRQGETRERFAARYASLAPSLPRLTAVHLSLSLGRPSAAARAELVTLCRQVAAELSQSTRPWKRALGGLNPLGWWFTR